MLNARKFEANERLIAYHPGVVSGGDDAQVAGVQLLLRVIGKLHDCMTGQSGARRDVVVEAEHIGRVVLRLQRRQPFVRRRLVGCAARLRVGDRQEV